MGDQLGNPSTVIIPWLCSRLKMQEVSNIEKVSTYMGDQLGTLNTARLKSI